MEEINLSEEDNSSVPVQQHQQSNNYEQYEQPLYQPGSANFGGGAASQNQYSNNNYEAQPAQDPYYNNQQQYHQASSLNNFSSQQQQPNGSFVGQMPTFGPGKSVLNLGGKDPSQSRPQMGSNNSAIGLNQPGIGQGHGSPTHANEDGEENFGDDLSDGLGSDNEAAVHIGVEKLNQVRNDQSHKNAFAQQPIQIDLGQPSVRRQFLDSNQASHQQSEQPNVPPEVQELIEMFPQMEPIVIMDVYEQLGGNRELVIEYCINGKISERQLQEAQRAQPRERSAFEEIDDAALAQQYQQQEHRRNGRQQQRRQQQRDYESEEDGNHNEDADARYARKLQEKEVAAAREEERMIAEQKKIEKMIRQQQQQKQRMVEIQQQQPSNGSRSTGVNSRASQPNNSRQSIPNVFEIRSDNQNVQAIDSDGNEYRSKQIRKKEESKQQPPGIQKSEQNGQQPDNRGGFFSMFCGCFQAKNKQRRPNNENQDQQQQIKSQSAAAPRQMGGRQQQYLVQEQQKQQPHHLNIDDFEDLQGSAQYQRE